MVERYSPRHAHLLLVLGYLLLGAAVIAALRSAARQSVVFGIIVVVASGSAVLTHRRLTTSLVRLVSKLCTSSEEASRRYTALAFVAIASLLAPLWGLEVLALFTKERPAQGLALALAAPVYVLIGALIDRKVDRWYSAPLYAAGCGMTVVALLLTLSSQPHSAAALALGCATYTLSSYFHRRSAWSYSCLFIAAGLALVGLLRLLFQA